MWSVFQLERLSKVLPPYFLQQSGDTEEVDVEVMREGYSMSMEVDSLPPFFLVPT